MNRRLQINALLLFAACLSTSVFAGGRGAINVRPKFQQRWNAAVSSSSNVRTYSRSYSQPHYVRPASPTTVHPPVVVERIVHSAVVAPPVASQVPTFPAGATLSLSANFLGEQPGNVFLVFDKIKLPVAIQTWSNESVTVTLPAMAIKEAVRVRLDVVRPDGSLGMSQSLRITSPAPVIVHAPGAASPLPTQTALSAGSPLTSPSQSNALVAIAPAPTAVQSSAAQISANNSGTATSALPFANGGIIIHNGPTPNRTLGANDRQSPVANQPAAVSESTTIDWDSNPLLQDSAMEVPGQADGANMMESNDVNPQIPATEADDNANPASDEDVILDKDTNEGVIVPEPALQDAADAARPLNAVVRAFRKQVSFGQ
ncbi:MAG: hypothetical protein R3C28_27325 [Pirellulaceae bacterium]